jgi:hypothetical protein
MERAKSLSEKRRGEAHTAEQGEVRASHEEVEGFMHKLRAFHASLGESEQAMLGTVLDAAVAGETGGYGARCSRSGEGQPQA